MTTRLDGQALLGPVMLPKKEVQDFHINLDQLRDWAHSRYAPICGRDTPSYAESAILLSHYSPHDAASINWLDKSIDFGSPNERHWAPPMSKNPFWEKYPCPR